MSIPRKSPRTISVLTCLLAATFFMAQPSDARPRGTPLSFETHAPTETQSNELIRSSSLKKASKKKRQKIAKRRRRRRRPPPKARVTPTAEPETKVEDREVITTSRRRPSRIEFDERLIRGQTNKADAIYLFERRSSEMRTLVKKRKHFHREIDQILE